MGETSLEGHYYPPITENQMETTIMGYIGYNIGDILVFVENQMEKKMENEMETGEIWGFKEQDLVFPVVQG